MANSTSKQIMEEGWRNAVVKLTGVLDTSDVNLTPAIQLSEFTNNDTRQTLVGFEVAKIEYSVGVDDLNVLLSYQSNSPEQLANLAGSGKLCPERGSYISPNREISGYTGNINLQTRGYVPGTVRSYTVILHMIKLYR